MTYEINGRHVTGKLGRMRKEQSFTVSPMSDGEIMVQSDRSIGSFDFRTRLGRLSVDGAYFHHLDVAPSFEFPAEFVAACLRACPQLDSQTVIAGGSVIVENTVEVVGSVQRRLFQLGRLCVTPGALDRLGELKLNSSALLDRHQSGDWGDVGEEDRSENELAIHEGLRLLSIYGPADCQIWVITEADRSATTLLLPEEY